MKAYINKLEGSVTGITIKFRHSVFLLWFTNWKIKRNKYSDGKTYYQFGPIGVYK